MDEVSLYNRALSHEELQAIYHAGSLGKCQAMAPFIVSQPANQTTLVGGSASFSVTAGGNAPLSYQWRFESNALSGATNRLLNLSNVQLSDAGSYSVVVSNAFGTVTSSNAVLTVSTGACVSVPAGIISWWPAQGNGGDVAGTNPATVSSGVSYSPGEVGQAFNFDGTSGSIMIPASASLNVGAGSGFSVECWIKPADLTPLHPIVEWNNGSTFGVHFYHSTSWFGNNVQGNLLANIVDTDGRYHPVFTAGGLLTTSNFQHVALTYEKTSGVGKLYVNGAEVASANLGTFTPQTSYNLYLGHRPSGGAQLYGGSMDEVSIYARALNGTEIHAIYDAGAAGKCQSSAPLIVTQPKDQSAVVGGSASFSVVAGGSQPLSYQWRLESNPLAGATTSVLTLTNVQSSDAGNYSVVVSNAFGTITSSNAILTVNLAVCTNAPSGLVSWWAGEGNGNDAIGSNPATVNGGVSYSGGEAGQAFNFDGNSGSLMAPSSASLNVGTGPGFSVECWIKPADFTPLHPIVEWNNGSSFGVHLYHSTSWFGDNVQGNLLANIVDTAGGFHPVYTSGGLLTTSNFQHVALTYDKASGVGKLYLNGVEVASANLGSFTPQTGYDLYLGRRPSGGTQLYEGLMDEVSLYARALTLTEIQAIYNAGAGGKCHEGPIAVSTQNSLSMLPIVAKPEGYEIRFSGIPNREYELQRAATLDGPWITLTTVFANLDGLGAYTDATGHSKAAFYRLVLK
jgi:hypothetical protein